MIIHPRLGCSSITLRKLPLDEALETISDLGFEEIDLGALPGITDHVPYNLTDTDVDRIGKQLRTTGIKVRSVNADIGDLNAPLSDIERSNRTHHLHRLLTLTRQIGAVALVLPNGALDHSPIADEASDVQRVAKELSDAAEAAKDYELEIWCETLHVYRLCHNQRRAQLLHDAVAQQKNGDQIGIVLDLSHLHASNGNLADFISKAHQKIRHVHLRDAIPGNINLSLGNGTINFKEALSELRRHNYRGHFTLELETHDVTDAERPAAAARAAQLINSLI